jgi:hypothetical protein
MKKTAKGRSYNHQASWVLSGALYEIGLTPVLSGFMNALKTIAQPATAFLTFDRRRVGYGGRPSEMVQ